MRFDNKEKILNLEKKNLNWNKQKEKNLEMQNKFQDFYNSINFKNLIFKLTFNIRNFNFNS